MFQKIKSTVNCIDHIAKHVELRHGNPMAGRCPFHNNGQEHTPSFKVYVDHWWCFGCNEGGSVIDFEMKRLNLSALDAARSLCIQYGIVVSQEEQESYFKIENVRKLKIERARAIPQYRESRPEIIEYLKKERGFSDQTIIDFCLGVSSKEKAVIVPIRDKFGRVVAFARRIIDYKERGCPKWLNDAEDEVYKKGSILYNLDQARRNIINGQRLIMCESYFDVVALWEAGVKTGVAYCSSKVTREQVAEIKDLALPGMTLLFTACTDKVAKDKILANRMIIHSAIPDLHMRAIVIPDDCKDLNDVLLKHGAAKITEIIGDSVAMDRYILDQVLAAEPVIDIQYRKAKEVLSLAETPLSKHDLIKYLAGRWNKDEATVTQYMTGAVSADGGGAQFKNMPMLVAEYEKFVREIDQHRILFPWPQYNKLTRGMKPGDVIQFIARSGTGKTMWAQQMMLGIGQQMPHIPMISYSLEQKGIMAFERYMQMEGGMLATDVERWMKPGEDAHNSLIYGTAQSLCRKLSNLLVCDQGGLSLQKIEAHTRDAAFSYFGRNVGIIFVDYMGYLKWEGSWKSIYEMVSMIARELKEVAKRLNCVVVSLHQITKAGKPGEPIEAYHARDSGAVEESADILIGAWRPELREGILEQEKNESIGVWKTKMLKNRYGPSDVIVDFKFIPELLRLEPLTPRSKEQAVQAALTNVVLPPAPGFQAPVPDAKERAVGKEAA